MAEQDNSEDELILDDQDVEEVESEEVAADQAEDPDVERPTFADEGEEKDGDTDLVRHLRAQLREEQKARKAVEQAQAPKPKIVVGEKPTLESCEWDEERFDREYDAYQGRKRAAEAESNAGQEIERKRAEDLTKVVQTYATKRAALPYSDKDDAEATVFAALSEAQKEILLRVANDPAKLTYALGHNGSKLAALASLQVVDLATVASFSSAVTKMDGELKMAKRRPAAQPDKPVRGSATLSATDPYDAKIDKAYRANDFDEMRRLRQERDARKAA